VVRDTGAGAAAALAARERWRTETRWFGHPAGAGLRESFIDLAARAGLREAPPRRTSPPDCGVLVGVGEPDRDLLDGWTRSGTPYLLVRLTEGRAVVGPFVLPGTTACLRCVDAHHTDLDPAWPLLVRQYASAAAHDRPDGAPEPVDPLLATLALAWAARDLASYVDGGRPSTWSSTLTLHPRLSRLETRAWLRHPACGCCWD
jgi:bacteriocin biosynthesis cyclodehydratase domain-containing protein